MAVVEHQRGGGGASSGAEKLPILSECEYSPAARLCLLDIMENRYTDSHDQSKVDLQSTSATDT